MKRRDIMTKDDSIEHDKIEHREIRCVWDMLYRTISKNGIFVSQYRIQESTRRMIGIIISNCQEEWWVIELEMDSEHHEIRCRWSWDINIQVILGCISSEGRIDTVLYWMSDKEV